MNADDGILNINIDQHEIDIDGEEEDAAMVVEEHGAQDDTDREQEGEPEPVKKEVKYPFKYQLDLSRLNIFYSNIEMPADLLRNVPEKFIYKVMTGTLEEIVHNIKQDIKDPEPKLLILHCFGTVLLCRTNQSVIDAVYDLINTVDDKGIHKIAPSTCHFIPDKPGTWEHVAHFNAEMRIANIDRGLPPLTLHKSLMDRQFETYGPLIIKGSMWLEYVQKTGLGHTLSWAGFLKYRHFIMRAFENQFEDMERNPSKRWMGVPRPPPLVVTPGYEGNAVMYNILKDRNLIDIRNIYTRVDPPPLRFQPKVPKVPQPGTQEPNPRSSSVASASNNETAPEAVRSKTWYGKGLTVSDDGAQRKVSLTSNKNDSGFFNESRMETETNYNEDEHDDDKFDDLARERNGAFAQAALRRSVSYEDLETAYYRLERRHNEDEQYYKEKIDNLLMENENLRDDKDDLKSEIKKVMTDLDKLSADNEALRNSEDTKSIKLKSALKKIDARDEEIKLKDERLEMLEEQYNFVKDLQHDMGDLLYDKQDKKKKRKDSK